MLHPANLPVPWLGFRFKGSGSPREPEWPARDFRENQPMNTWQLTRASEYGFYANVNPAVDHPRWSQASERRIGELFRRKTLPFNGYADQVASLYTGMDLRKFY